MKKFLIDVLKELYYAEHTLTEAMLGFENAATTVGLKEAFDDGQVESQKHIKRLERVFKFLMKCQPKNI